MPKLTDIAIVEAIMETGSIAGACKKLDCPRRTMSRRIRSPSCQKMLTDAVGAAIKETSASMSTQMMTAVAVINKTLCDNDIAPQIRLNAAQLLLSYALKFVEISDIESRIAALEEAAQEEGVQQ